MRVVLLSDGLAPPLGGPVEVCAVAKRELKGARDAGRLRDFMTDGEAVNVHEDERRTLPARGLVDGCRLLQNIRQGAVIRYDDVELRPARLADRLPAEQYRHFRGESWLELRLLIAA